MIKTIFFFLTGGLMTVSAAVHSQNTRISYSANNVVISEVLKQIENRTTYHFAYSNNLFPADLKVTFRAKDEPVSNILNKILSNTGYSYQVMNENLIILTKSSVPFADITGRVTDEQNNPLPGVTVRVKGQSKAYSTDENGVYNIQTSSEAVVLEFSYIGYTTIEVNVSGQKSVNVKMKTSEGALNEVLVVGYGTQSRTTIISSVSAIDGAELAKVPTANVTQSLAGRLPGLIATNTSGRPGADGATLLVRGLSTPGDNSPLIVIDGVVRSNFTGRGALAGAVNSQVSADGATRGNPINPLDYLDPNDIESISILKDAAATAIYGARAANGAILVTTKRGARGVTSVSYSGNFGQQSAVRLIKPLDSYQIAQLWNLGWQNEGQFAPTYGGARGYSPEALEAIRTGSDPNRFGNSDWYNAVFGKNAFQQSHNISVNGGNEKGRFFVSGGLFDQDGLYKASGLKRYNIRANVDAKILNVFDFALNLAGRKELRKASSTDPTQAAILNTPIEPIQFTNGTYLYDQPWVGNAYLLSQGEGGYNNLDNSNFESSASLSYNVPFIQGLTVKGLFSYDTYFSNSKRFNKAYTTYILNDDNTFSVPVSVSSALASLSQTNNQYQSMTTEASLSYNRKFQNHSLSGLLVYTETLNQGSNLSAGRINYPSPILDIIDLGSLTGVTNGGSALRNARRGVVSRLAYNYKEKYFIEFDARYDGSDLFPPGERYGFFPAVSAGWRLSEESFIKDKLTFINNLKLRASWGKAGNDREGAFQYLNAYSIPGSGGYGFGGSTGQTLTPGVIANPIFSWEKATTTNVGLDASLWNNKLGIVADYFHKRTSDVLLPNTASVPSIIGGSLPIGNYGIVDNSGFELQLTHQNKIGKFGYSVSPNITYNRSKVVAYPEAASTPEQLRLVGKQVQPGTLITGYIADGFYQNQQEITSGPTPLFASTKPGDIKYVDYDGDGRITASDRIIISNGTVPRTLMGLNLSFRYENFELSTFFQGATGSDVVIPGAFTDVNYAGKPVSFPLHLDYWTPDNPNASFPRITVTTRNSSERSTFWVRDGSYLRLKTAELAYTIPSEWIKKVGVSNARIFVGGTNLLTFSNLKGIMDPETQVLNYPLVKVFNAGVNVKF